MQRCQHWSQIFNNHYCTGPLVKHNLSHSFKESWAPHSKPVCHPVLWKLLAGCICRQKPLPHASEFFGAHRVPPEKPLRESQTSCRLPAHMNGTKFKDMNVTRVGPRKKLFKRSNLRSLKDGWSREQLRDIWEVVKGQLDQFSTLKRVDRSWGELLHVEKVF